MSNRGTTVSVIAGCAVFAVAVWSGFRRGTDRDLQFHAEKQCREIRFSTNADVARDIAARSGGIVQPMPQAFPCASTGAGWSTWAASSSSSATR
jgi:hypothetical protein